MTTKSNPTYTLKGRIANRQDESLPELTVRAHSQNERSRDVLLGEATTDREGRYGIRYTWTQPDSRDQKSVGPDVYNLVFASDEQIGRSPLNEVYPKLKAVP